MTDDRSPPTPEPGLQVERRDCAQLLPSGRPRVRGMRGFDPARTDIVDDIVRGIHRIWDDATSA
jgi:hypothetical protein